MKTVITAKTVLYAAGLLLAFGAGWFVEWWNSPAGEPLCLARGGDILQALARSLPDGYVVVWSVIAGAVILPTWGLLAWIGASLARIARYIGG